MSFWNRLSSFIGERRYFVISAKSSAPAIMSLTTAFALIFLLGCIILQINPPRLTRDYGALLPSWRFSMSRSVTRQPLQPENVGTWSPLRLRGVGLLLSSLKKEVFSVSERTAHLAIPPAIFHIPARRPNKAQ
jgi:hypothetical protein